MKVLKSLFISFAVFSQITVFASYAPDLVVEEKKTVSTTSNSARGKVYSVKSDYSALIEKYALKFDISPTLTSGIIRCESGNNRYALNDTPGVEFSVGLAQINLLAHTNITREQAEDPEFAINFLAEHIASGDAPRMWYTCYKKATQ
jgi:soluble lytic murein transglycosylase-like protein